MFPPLVEEREWIGRRDEGKVKMDDETGTR
jgi:hypothetical protein